MYFKRMGTVTADTTWQSYTKKAGPPTLSNATQLRHARPMWRGGATGSAKSGLVAVTSIDRASGDGTFNLFGLAQCHDRTCDHAVYEWSDNGTSLKPFENNPILGGGAQAAYGVPAALAAGAGGIVDVEMFYGPDGLLHAVGCPAANGSSAASGLTAKARTLASGVAEFAQCHHYVNGGPSEVGATPGVQWYGPVGLSGATRVTQTNAAHPDGAGYPRLPWLRGATPVPTLHNTYRDSEFSESCLTGILTVSEDGT